MPQAKLTMEIVDVWGCVQPDDHLQECHEDHHSRRLIAVSTCMLAGLSENKRISLSEYMLD